jgi:2-oxoisovalerate dehydrogenase E1 component
MGAQPQPSHRKLPPKPTARSFNRAEVIDYNFVSILDSYERASSRVVGLYDPVREGYSLTGGALLELFESQMKSRHLDLIARFLRARNAAFYTIGSSGHEGNVVVGRATRHTDPAFLHYRSGALFCERARQVSGVDPVYDTILGQAASSEEPIAGGRHKVWGSVPMWVLPQTSTIASQLPKAVGCAIAIGRAKKMTGSLPVPADSIAVCSFGDASANHSTAAGAINSAAWTSVQRLPVPILFVCEDNGLGISVRTPGGWIASNFRNRPCIKYFSADGLDVVEAYEVAQAAVDYCRTHRSPTFLHLSVVRMLGHAGSDNETVYRTFDDIESTEARDPLLATARIIVDAGLMTVDEVLDQYESIRGSTREAADRAIQRPRLTSAAEVIAPLAPHHDEAVRLEASRRVDDGERVRAFEGEDKLPEKGGPKHLAVQINRALFDLMVKYPETLVFGEDVAQKGGVYNVTTGLHKTFKAGRVFNTLLDEQTILGLAQGCGYMGLLPLPEIQYLAYFHNACDQIRGEAASMQFFSNGQYRNPMVIRIASLGYQKGFGGHFHNDNSMTALRDIPGIVVACPSRGDDAAAMLRTCVAMAKVDGRVVAFLEPIALYMTRDLHEEGDGLWQFDYPAPESAVPLGEERVYGALATDLCIFTFGNGVHMSLQAAKRLYDAGIDVRVVDLRWLVPLNEDAISRHSSECGAILIVDEGRRSGGVSEGMMTGLVEHGLGGKPISRVAGEDTYIPLGPAADHVLPSVDRIVEAGRTVSERSR